MPRGYVFSQEEHQLISEIQSFYTSTSFLPISRFIAFLGDIEDHVDDHDIELMRSSGIVSTDDEVDIPRFIEWWQTPANPPNPPQRAQQDLPAVEKVHEEAGAPPRDAQQSTDAHGSEKHEELAEETFVQKKEEKPQADHHAKNKQPGAYIFIFFFFETLAPRDEKSLTKQNPNLNNSIQVVEPPSSACI